MGPSNLGEARLHFCIITDPFHTPGETSVDITVSLFQNSGPSVCTNNSRVKPVVGTSKGKDGGLVALSSDRPTKEKFRSFCSVWYSAAASAKVPDFLWNRDGPQSRQK